MHAVPTLLLRNQKCHIKRHFKQQAENCPAFPPKPSGGGCYIIPVICKRDSLEVRCLVELDDSTHDARRDQDRDAVTTMAGYRTFRVRAARRYDIDALRRRVMDTQDLEERLSG